ncbi:RHS repeat protein [Mycetohabitans endofungorum]|uniref:RHS repeat domain-containing protein n=1 Tax=Mycetohabitans endofungorum TaxID=417203 RepID=UPI0030CF37A2
MPETLHSGTPTITVTDNRGLMVRTVQYSREKLGSPLDERITATTYSPAGLVQRQTDPRLFAQSDPSVANFNYGHDLLGHTLWTRSVDAGEHWSVLNSEGQPIAQQDARGTVTLTEYDSLGRLTQVSEQLTGHDPIVLTQLTYGDADNNDPEKKVAAQRANLCGVLSQQCDTAGQLTTPGMTVTGQPQAQLRRLLKATQGEADWGAATPPNLEIDAYTTAWTYNALGQPLTQTDAMSNVQQSTYDVAGRLALVKLKQKQDANFKTLLASIQYSAQGQLEREAAGNGVTTTYTYDPKTLRLMQSQAKDGNGTVRQQLAYEYDPVGNIVSIEDQAIAPAFFNNEQIQAKATYAYDSLYQLVRATGREQTDAQQSSQLPPLIHPPSPGARTNYTRTYTYDRGGNLIGICGERGSRFTQTMTISQGSNRLAAVTGSGLQAGNTISNLQYDANGNPGALGTNVLKQLQWDGRNQLRHVIMLERTGGAPNDEEWYQYEGNGQRIRKTTFTLAKQEDQSQHVDEVIYLPGLQLRRRFNVKNDVVEELHIVTVQAGRAQIRVLHWNKGQPDKIENNQIRYSLDNHLGSSVMELDQTAQLLTYEEYYPYGGTAVWAAKSELEAKYKIIRYSGKERDATGLYYYGFRYYGPWLGRWLNPDPAGTMDGLGLFIFTRNNPLKLLDRNGLVGENSFVESNRKRKISNHGEEESAKIKKTGGNPFNYMSPNEFVEKKGRFLYRAIRTSKSQKKCGEEFITVLPDGDLESYRDIKNWPINNSITAAKPEAVVNPLVHISGDNEATQYISTSASIRGAAVNTVYSWGGSIGNRTYRDPKNWDPIITIDVSKLPEGTKIYSAKDDVDKYIGHIMESEGKGQDLLEKIGQLAVHDEEVLIEGIIPGSAITKIESDRNDILLHAGGSIDGLLKKYGNDKDGREKLKRAGLRVPASSDSEDDEDYMLYESKSKKKQQIYNPYR